MHDDTTNTNLTSVVPVGKCRKYRKVGQTKGTNKSKGNHIYTIKIEINIRNDDS